jgi:hypothetical protein
MTHRQFLAWTAWLEEQWNQPDRADYYQMQTSAVIAVMLGKKGRRPKASDFKIAFDMKPVVGAPGTGADPAAPGSVEEATAWSKARWYGLFGRPGSRGGGPLAGRRRRGAGAESPPAPGTAPGPLLPAPEPPARPPGRQRPPGQGSRPSLGDGS